PQEWIASLIEVLKGSNADLQAEAIATIRNLRIPPGQSSKLTAVLLQIGSNARIADKVRINALSALPDEQVQLEPAIFDFVRSHLNADQPVDVRTAASLALAKAKLDCEQLLALAETLKTVGPMELNRLLDAFGQSKEDKVGHELIDALKASPLRSSL